MRSTFHQLRPDGRYQPLVIGRAELEKIADGKEHDVVYHSLAVPGLSLSMRKLLREEIPGPGDQGSAPRP
jgi:hypothetical protein